MAVEMELTRVLIRETDDTHVVELREKGGERVFPIMIGMTEAAAIERRLMGHPVPRPMTHDLLDSVIRETGYRLVRVVINDLQDHTFFARLILQNAGHTLDIDARPSDAIALGVATETPIFVNETVLNAASLPDELA